MKRVPVVPVAVVALMVTVGPATAAEEIEVGLAECFGVGSGESTVPAGSTVVLSYGWTDTSRTLVRRFLRLQSTTASLDGVALANAGSLWGPIGVDPIGGGPMTVWSYSTGITLSAGESLQVDYDVRVSKRLRTGDGTVYPAGSSVFPDSPMSCRITASP